MIPGFGAPRVFVDLGSVNDGCSCDRGFERAGRGSSQYSYGAHVRTPKSWLSFGVWPKPRRPSCSNPPISDELAHRLPRHGRAGSSNLSLPSHIDRRVPRAAGHHPTSRANPRASASTIVDPQRAPRGRQTITVRSNGLDTAHTDSAVVPLSPRTLGLPTTTPDTAALLRSSRSGSGRETRLQRRRETRPDTA